jgi:hypothetical protein
MEKIFSSWKNEKEINFFFFNFNKSVVFIYECWVTTDCTTLFFLKKKKRVIAVWGVVTILVFIQYGFITRATNNPFLKVDLCAQKVV